MCADSGDTLEAIATGVSLPSDAEGCWGKLDVREVGLHGLLSSRWLDHLDVLGRDCLGLNYEGFF